VQAPGAERAVVSAAVVKLIALVLLAAIAGCGAPPRPLCSTAAPQATGLPATAEARIAADYVATFDAGDPAALVAYAHAHRSPLATQTSDAELATGYRHMASALAASSRAPCTSMATTP